MLNFDCLNRHIILVCVLCVQVMVTSCSNDLEGVEHDSVQALASAKGFARPRSAPSAFPTTVEDGWSGTAQCMLTADKLNSTAIKTLATLERYSAPIANFPAGLQLTESPGLLVDALAELTSNLSKTEMRRLARNCRTVYCAVNRIFGEPNGLRILYLLVRYGYNASHLADKNAAPWASEELGDVILAFEDMPAGIVPFYSQSKRPLVREANEHRITDLFPKAAGQAVAMNSGSNEFGIRAFPGWNELPQRKRRAAIFHELAHDFFRQQEGLVQPEALWGKAMKADEALQMKARSRRTSVSAYGASNVYEDFAESAVAYRYMPELLRRSPNRSSLLKSWLFDELSYESPADCAPSRSLTNRAAVSAFNIIPKLYLSESQKMAVVTTCQQRLRNTPSGSRITFGRLCVGRELYRAALAKTLRTSLESNDDLDRITARTANEKFLEYRFGSIENHRVLALTDAKALKYCGSTCHAQPH